MIPIEYSLIIVSLLLITSILMSKATGWLGIPSLLLFLLIGMLMGSEGIGGIAFDEPLIAQSVGVVALIFILFSGGLDTNWKSVRPVLREGIALSTVGVFITALLLGLSAMWLLDFTFYEGLLLGSIVSSTDAAAVFSVLRSRKLSLSEGVKPLLELESGSNDPMAVFLTLGLITLITNPGKPALSMIPLFFLQMGFGAVTGYLIGRATVYFINRIKLEYDGLYPVLTLAIVLLIYGTATYIGGNGFLAVYVAGLVMGNSGFIHRKSLMNFHNGLAWLMQIAMFLTLGLLVFPSRLVPVAGAGIVISIVLMILARPLGVLLTLLPFRLDFKERIFVAWVGLRGSVPIILATFPLLAGIDSADIIFNLVFFIVLTSALLQGTTIPSVARLLGVEAPRPRLERFPLEFDYTDSANTRLIDFTVPYASQLAGKTVVDLDLPGDSLITLVYRGDNFIIPGGKTVLEEADVLLILVNDKNFETVQSRLLRW